ARALRRVPERLDAARTPAGLRRDVRPAAADEPLPELLPARGHTQARHRAAATEAALRGGRPRAGTRGAAGLPAARARVLLARAGRARRAAAARAPAGARAAALEPPRRREPVRGPARRALRDAAETERARARAGAPPRLRRAAGGTGRARAVRAARGAPGARSP